MYRPQFAYPLAAPPCETVPCQYSFDATNTPVMAGTLAAAAQTSRIPLSLDLEADFYLRGIEIQGAASVRLVDPDGNPLSDADNADQLANFMLPIEYGDTNGAGLAVLDSGAGGVFANGGGNFLLYLYNGTGSSIDLKTCAINLYGVKVYKGRCK